MYICNLVPNNVLVPVTSVPYPVYILSFSIMYLKSRLSSSYFE
nr:hypothetical protein [Brachyspira pilosicoli]